jgi:hypothetical protein
MKRELLIPLLRRADANINSVPVPAALENRVRESLARAQARGSAGRQRRLNLVFAIATTAVALLAALAIEHRTSRSACMSVNQELMSLEGGCTVDLPQLRIETTGEVHLRQTGNGFEMLDGSALFAVTPVPAGHPPLRIRVSGGTIEVIGTRFRVHERKTGGTIELMEGTIRFIFPDGKVSVLHAGETLRWGVPDGSDSQGPGAARTGESDRAIGGPPAAGSSSESSIDRVGIEVSSADGGTNDSDRVTDVTLENIEPGRVPPAADIRRRFDALGREESYTEAEQLRLQLEPVSFELGEAYEREHAPTGRICAHWRWHLQRFPSGIYNGSIRAKLTHLHCPSVDP